MRVRVDCTELVPRGRSPHNTPDLGNVAVDRPREVRRSLLSGGRIALEFTTGQGMGSLRIVDRRKDERATSDLVLVVWGVDTRGERFVQQARARDISRGGALLSGLEGDLRSGDVIGILFAGKKARFRVIWVRHSGTAEKLQAAVQRVEGDLCPWEELLREAPATIVET